ncbi:hypothetical protein NODU109028_04730 [Nocardioides dubius]
MSSWNQESPIRKKPTQTAMKAKMVPQICVQ